MDTCQFSGKLPEEFTRETMQRLLDQLAGSDDPFTGEGLRRMAGASPDRELAEIARELGDLLDAGGSLDRVMLLMRALPLGTDGFVRLARLTGNREGLVVAAQLLESGLLQPNSPAPADEAATFCAYLSCLLQAGVPVVQAFDWAGRRFPSLAAIAAEIASEAREGRRLADVLAGHRDIFATPFVGAIRLAESTGTLDAVLAALAALLWEPSLLDTRRVGGKWSERLERAREGLRQDAEWERRFREARRK